ncbi:MAG: hypothetical protein JW956_01695 [Calditrichaceae bacterium]|nr:hypothetical protein [Calditrichaceae bacterium]
MIRYYLILISLFVLISNQNGSAQSKLETQLKTIIEKEKMIQSLEDSIAAVSNKETAANIETKKSQIKKDILAIKSDIYNSEHTDAIWVEGEGEIILDEKKPFEQNKRLVEMFARRDAMEKGGKLIVESLTTLKRFEVDAEAGSGVNSKYIEEFESIIESKGKVKVVDQDLNGDFGKVTTVEEDGIKKLKTKVRLKISSLDDVNPFKQELEELK